MSSRAVIIGVNDYSQQQSLPAGWSVGNLSSCVADAESMYELLTDQFGFEVTSYLTDFDASRGAILDAIRALLTDSEAGDVVAVFYSGHGGRFPADENNASRYYEAMIPASGEPITDLDLVSLADRLDPGFVNLTLILDRCFSGGLHENTPDSTLRTVAYDGQFIDLCTAQMSTIVPCGVTLPPGSNALDGNVWGVVGQGNGVVCSVDDNLSLFPLSKSTLVTACRYDEVAVEQNGHGALTQGLLDVINQSSPTISYLDLIDRLRDDVQNTLLLTQTPTLLGQQNRMNENFLAAWTTSV
jgi:hypothetical protein